ncbi:MAG: DUF222 domain-containing protein [Acidimicrobiia bacterium]
MVAMTEFIGVVTEADVDNAFIRVNAALIEALAILGEFDAQGGWEIAGAGSPVSWLASRGHCTKQEAAVHVRNARLMRKHETVQDAANERSITPSHLTQLSHISKHRSQRFNADVEMLVGIAQRTQPEEFRTTAKYWGSLADDLLAPEERDEKNALDIAETFRGSWVVRGVFDPVRGAALNSMILEHSAPEGVDDDRTASERRADAFFTLLCRNEPIQPKVDVIVDVDTLVGLGRPLEEIRCELQGVGAIPRIVMERLACTPQIGRVLTRGQSEVLDLGRQVRIASSAQRRAVNARDRGCVWPYCKRPPAMCEVHHLVPWQHGGDSNVDNLALLCGHHHTRVHQGWKLHQCLDGTWDARAP